MATQNDTMDIFNVAIPKNVPHVPAEVLNPRNTWEDKAKFDETAAKLGAMFVDNFKKYASEASAELLAAAPQVPGA